MAYTDPMPGSLKRKRRRRADRLPSSAKLQLVDGLTGEEAEVSADLFSDLFPHVHDQGTQLYIAVCSHTPVTTTLATSSTWTIIPCKPATSNTTNSPRAQIRVPVTCQTAQALHRALKLGPVSRQNGQSASVDVKVTDIVPLPLETVYVSLDLDGLLKSDESQKKYGGGFRNKHLLGRQNGKVQSNGTSRTQPKSIQDLKDEMLPLIRNTIRDIAIIHTGDLIQLSLAAHPITHSAPPSAVLSACEPVLQGTVSASTRIVILSETEIHQSRTRTTQSPVIPSYQVQSPLDEVEEDTANEDFFTAAEDGNLSSAPNTPKKRVTLSDSQDSEAEESGTDLDLSGDEEDMISLTGPTLGSQTSGMMSSLTAATPRPFGYKASGVQTPGSVFSSMTSATVRGGQSAKSKVLKTHGLLERIPDELLHPSPSAREDEEARAYVDINVLARLGCFSGDWVELSMAGDPALTGLASLAMSSFTERDPDSLVDVRAVKVYGLPEALSNKPARYQIQNRTGRRDSISSVQPAQNPTPSLYLSPILLANMGEPAFLRISPMPPPEREVASLRLKNKMPATSAPPKAKEASLVKLQTPISVDKALDMNALNALRDYFEAKQRIVKTGDLVAVQIDEELGRAIFEGSTVEDDDSNALLSELTGLEGQQDRSSKAKGVAWFRIASVVSPTNDDPETPDPWSGLVIVDPSSTHMRQSGTEQRNLPPAMNSAWPYYEGLLSTPTPSQDLKPTGPTKLPVAHVSQLRRRLRELMSAATSARATYLGLPPVAILIHSSQRNIGKAYTTKRVCFDLGIHYYPIDAYDILSESTSGGGDVKTGGLFSARADRALSCGAEHTCMLIRHIDALSSDRMYSAIKDVLADSRVLIATTTDIDKVSENLRGLFTHEMEMSAPDEGEREGILRSIIAESSIPISASVDLASIAVKTAALVAGDLHDVVDRAVAAQTQRLESLAEAASQTATATITVRDIERSGGDAALCLMPADFEVAVDEARKNFADSIGAPKIPNVQWSDVGGLANVKDAVMETIQLPLSRPELFAKGLKKRSGILFYGPPGTGKTLLAKAIATEFSLNFFSVKGPELLNMYIGESEANVRRVFQRARDARPCVVFFDELDSVAPKRGNQGDSGGVMDRIVSQLLAELDGMGDGDSEDGGGSGVFVIGATNRPDLLDQALLRPGRFDKMLYLGVSDTHEKQSKILEALTRKFTLSQDLILREVADILPFTYTGADLYALCSDAMLKAITRSAQSVDKSLATINGERAALTPPKTALTIAQFFDHHATDADLKVEVQKEDFMSAQRELVPSVSADELAHYDRVRRDFEGADQKREEAPKPKYSSMPPASASQEEMERWQAAKIEELMRGGFSDGSLARNDPKNKGKGKAPATQEAAHNSNGASKSLPLASTPSSAPPALNASQEDLEKWQAAKIEELMRAGFSDGSLARNDPKGKGKGKAPMPQENGGNADLAFRTSDMNLNGHSFPASRMVSDGGIEGKGKGKAKAIDGDQTDQDNFGNAAQDEELY